MAFVPIYILILGFTIIIDYFAGIYLEKFTGKSKKIFLAFSLIANIGVLAVFKYYHFIDQNIGFLSNLLGAKVHLPVLNILLPIGLSFHTFQAMSYTIEVYRGNQKAERNFGIYSLYVMFYPQLVAGPIERPQNLLHQFYEKHDWDWSRVKSGLLQMAFGIFKKVVIADRIALLVDPAYGDLSHQSGMNLVIAAFFYSFQIYCDFSGYSDVAIGASRVMGFKLMDNFNAPYLAKSLPEFWRRWHISLSTWFKDYVYFSLGGNRVSIPKWYINIMIVFILSGIWHGASWNFIIWGFLHGAFQVIGLTLNRFFPALAADKIQSTFVKVVYQIWTFTLVTLAWVFFRIPKFSDLKLFFKQISSISFKDSLSFELNTNEIILCLTLVILLIFAEKWQWKKALLKGNYFWLVFLLCLTSVYFLGVFNLKQFIYFQF
jgi:D-alanyl-lipoteichoic acid acyltransferase DltB (MBOAT superfamily)